MSHKLASCAGLLVMVAVATPYLGALLAPGAANVGPGARVITSAPLAPVLVVAPLPAPAEPIAVEVEAPDSDSVYGDPKTPDFDPEHPPARMGEPG